MTNDQDVNFDDFEVVNERATLWECKQTGSTKEGNLTKLKESEDSWVVGYYLGCDTGLGQEKRSTAHKLKIFRKKDNSLMIGSKKHLSGNPAETNDIISMWGSNVLDGKIAENVQPGQLIKVTWLGTKAPKSGGKHYHNWEIAVNHKVAPLTSVNTSPAEADFADEDNSAVEPAPVAETSPANSQAFDEGFDKDFDDEF